MTEFPAGARDAPLLQTVFTSPLSHSTLYKMGTGVSYPGT